MCLIGEVVEGGWQARPARRQAAHVAVLAPPRLVAIVLVLWLVMLLGASRAEAVPSVTYSCSPAPANCAGWFRSNVAIDWTVLPSNAAMTGCQDKSYTTDTAGTSEYCRADDGQAAVTVELTIRVDKTRPVVTGGQPSRAADANGWYNHAVGVAFAGSDQTSGIAACTSTSYGGPDSGAASVQGTCTDRAGNVSAPFGYGLRYDASGPLISGVVPERPADFDGWFTRPVLFNPSAADATSGLAECPPIGYGGPDTASVTLTASCRDRAGNLSTRAVALKYDATAPPLSDLGAVAGDRSVAVGWKTSADTQAVEVVRTPGVAPEPATVVFRGPGASFIDSRVDNGVRYGYEVRVRDAAGNASTGTVSAAPTAAATPAGIEAPGQPGSPRAGRRGRRLIAPPTGAALTAGEPVLLRWTPVRRARYYNLQLYRAGRKILSAWPTKPRYRLKPTWRYRGDRYRLAPGRYRWVVWPGYGPRARADYGRKIGPSIFQVRRPTSPAT